MIGRERLVLAAGCATMALLGLALHAGAGRDDVFITLHAGEQLGAGRGLVGWNGERVEMSTSLLHVWLVAFLSWLGPTYLTNKLCGLAAGLAVLVVIHRSRELLFPDERSRGLAHALTIGALSTTPSFLYWLLGGLETPFVALLVTLLATSCLALWQEDTGPRRLRLCLVSSLLVCARPDAIYAIASCILLAGLAAWQGRSWRGYLSCGLAPIAMAGALIGWRLTSFEALAPNPVYAKLASFSAAAPSGLQYLLEFSTSSWLMTLVAAALLGAGAAALVLLVGRAATDAATSRWLIAVPALGVVASIVVGGGGWMEFHRFAQPALPLAVVLLFGLASPWLLRLRGAMRTVPVVVLLGLLAQNLTQESAVRTWGGEGWFTMHSTSRPLAWPRTVERIELANDVYARDAAQLFPFLEENLELLCSRTDGPLVIASPQMGQLPYWVRHRFPDLDVEFLDTRGICDPELARLAGPRGPFGLAEGASLTAIMSGEAGELSRVVEGRSPHLLYRVRMTDQDIRGLEELGFVLLHRAPMATVLFRE